jgi:mono/diheme cytochrome c family protein
MARTRSLLPTLLLIAGCGTGTIDGQMAAPDAGEQDPLAVAREAFDTTVQPLLEGFCAACHSATDAVGFMAPDPDMYSAVMTWPTLVDIESPASSRLLTKGSHDGPAWTAEQKTVIMDWLAIEADARGVEVTEEPETTAFTPVVGINTVDLTEIGLTGASVSFRLEKLQVGLYISELMLVGGPSGAHVVHPLFVTWTDDQPTPDPVDRFADIDLNVDPDDTQMIGGGTLVMVDVPLDAQLSIHFQVAEPAVDNPDVPLGGCKDVASFTANAQPMLSANCASCHAGGNAAATGATDMTQIDDLTPEGQAAACGQILSRVNLADPLNSGIYLAPDPNSGAGHPFKFGGNVTSFNAFRDALLVWINAEIAAP